MNSQLLEFLLFVVVTPLVGLWTTAFVLTAVAILFLWSQKRIFGILQDLLCVQHHRVSIVWRGAAAFSHRVQAQFYWNLWKKIIKKFKICLYLWSVNSLCWLLRFSCVMVGWEKGRAVCQLQLVLHRLKESESRGLSILCGAGHDPPGSGMTTKIIHFMVNGRLEQAEFGPDCSAADVKGKTDQRSF